MNDKITAMDNGAGKWKESRLTSRWVGPGMLGDFGVIVVCSGWLRGRAVRDPGRSARGR
jgi:hypothetical protein